MTNPILKNARLLSVFLVGFFLLLAAPAVSYGYRANIPLLYMVSGVAMSPITAVCISALGVAVIMLAWIDLDRVGVKAFFALIGSAFVVELTHYHEPETDALLQELLDNPQALTPERRVELKEAMILVSNNPKFSDRERRVAAVMPELIDLALNMERFPRARH